MTVTYAVHVQLLRAGSKAQARLWSRQKFTCQAIDWLRHKCRRAGVTREQREVRLAADRLWKQHSRAEETVQQRGSRLKHLRSTQAQHLAAETEEQRAARLQQLIAIYVRLQDSRVYILHTHNISLATNNRQPASVGQTAILCR